MPSQAQPQTGCKLLSNDVTKTAVTAPNQIPVQHFRFYIPQNTNNDIVKLYINLSFHYFGGKINDMGIK